MRAESAIGRLAAASEGAGCQRPRAETLEAPSHEYYAERVAYGRRKLPKAAASLVEPASEVDGRAMLDVSESGPPLCLTGEEGARLQLGGAAVGNGAAAGRAAPGQWNGQEPLIPAAGGGPSAADVEIKELSGAVLRADGCEEEEPAEPAGGGAPSVAHVWQDWRLPLAAQALGSASRACAVGAGGDQERKTYGQFCGPGEAEDRARLRYPRVGALEPAGGHRAAPRPNRGRPGGLRPDAAAHAPASLTMDGLGHIDAACGWAPSEELRDAQFRRGAIGPLGSGSGAGQRSPVVGEVGAAAARQRERPRMPCEPGRVAAPGAGWTRSAVQARDAELAALKVKREPAAAASKERWIEVAEEGGGGPVRRPGKYSRFADTKASPRRAAEFKARVLEATELAGDRAGYKYLGSDEPQALKELVGTTVVRTASLVDEGPCAGAPAASAIVEAAGGAASVRVGAAGIPARGVRGSTVGLAQSTAWYFGGLLHEAGEVAALMTRVAAATQYLYPACRASARAILRIADRGLTEGEAAQSGLSPSSSACEAGDGPADRGLTEGEAAQSGLSPNSSACEAGDGPEDARSRQQLQAGVNLEGDVTEPEVPARAVHLAAVPEHVPVKSAPAPLGMLIAPAPEHAPVKAPPAPLGMLIGGSPSPPYSPWGAAARGPPLDCYPPDGHCAPTRMHDDAYAPLQRVIEVLLQQHGLPAPPPVRAPPRAEQGGAPTSAAGSSSSGDRGQARASAPAPPTWEPEREGVATDGGPSSSTEGPPPPPPPPAGGARSAADEVRARRWHAQWQTPAVAAPRPPTSELGREGAAADGGNAIGQRRGQKTSATQTEPNRSLPTLGDGDCDVDSFLEEFEEMVGLTNDGSGMSAVERIRVLGTCLTGTRQRAYRVELEQARRSGRLADDPGDVYRSLKERMRGPKEGLLESERGCRAVRAAPAAGGALGPAAAPRREAPIGATAGTGAGGPCWGATLAALSEAEAEVTHLRDEVLRLRADAAARVGRGVDVDFLTAYRSLEEWARACREAENYVMVACFTLDHPAVIAYLEQVRARGVAVRVLYSGRGEALTIVQAPRLRRLRACGCEVRAHVGAPLHAKVMLTEQVVVLGSGNRTAAGEAHSERGVSLRGLPEQQLREQRQWFEQLFEASGPFEFWA